MTRPLPIPDSYWVTDMSLLAGEYPGDKSPVKARARLNAFLDAGVNVFIDLTTRHDPLEPYAELLQEEAAQRGINVTYVSLPIPDMGISDARHMNRVLDTIEEHLAAGRTVYFHCWGGVGRTGLVAGCHLVRRGSTGEDALATVRGLFATMSERKVRHHGGISPQTDAQCNMVRSWGEFDTTDSV